VTVSKTSTLRPSARIDGGHQLLRDTEPSRIAPHEHLGDFGAMRLIFGQRQHKLNRTDDVFRRVFGDEQGALGRSTFYTIDQHIGQRLNARIHVVRHDASDGPHVAHRLLRSGTNARLAIDTR
jgi:hypothetical protein